jgi:tetratricopeptide (TPR) repeat protein
MTFLYQWHEQDFERSVAEAEAAIQMVPYDALSRAALAGSVASAGRVDEAIEWSKESMRRDPTGLEWGIGYLSWAYYLAGRYEDALAELQKMREPWPLVLVPVDVRLGRIEEARTVMAAFVRANPEHTLEDEARWPLKEPLKQTYLDDLRKAGMPEQ